MILEILAMLLGTIRGTLRDPIFVLIFFGFGVLGFVSTRFVFFVVFMLVLLGFVIWLDSQVLWSLGRKYNVVYAFFSGLAAFVCAGAAYVFGRIFRHLRSA